MGGSADLLPKDSTPGARPTTLHERKRAGYGRLRAAPVPNRAKAPAGGGGGDAAAGPDAGASRPAEDGGVGAHGRCRQARRRMARSAVASATSAVVNPRFQ